MFKSLDLESLSLRLKCRLDRVSFSVARTEDAAVAKILPDALVNSLRKLILGGDEHGSRPSLNIDVCSEPQVQLVFEKSRYENVVPLTIPTKGGRTQSVRVVLTSSKEDRDLLEKDLKNMEEEQSRRIRGFREVIELISASQKPVVVHNSLNGILYQHYFTFIHSRFISPLPPTKDEFRSSLHSVFHDIRDINHLMKEVGPLNKYTNLPSAISYLKRNFFAPVEIDIIHKGLYFFSTADVSTFIPVV
ncbi:putative poly(A)-specific ribonuclease [Helianthus anomalus]